MKNTNEAVEITLARVFNIIDRPIVSPVSGGVRLRLRACGVCYSDAGTVENLLPGMGLTMDQ